MDHLPLPQGCKSHWKVKLFARLRIYEPHDFFRLPSMYGLPNCGRLVHRGLPTHFPSELVNEFLQSWLFFGLLARFLNRRIDAKDFVNLRDGTINTAPLSTLLNQWVANRSCAAPGTKTNEHKAMVFRIDHDTSCKALSIAQNFVSAYILRPGAIHDTGPEIPLLVRSRHGIVSIDDILGLSLGILGEALQQRSSESHVQIDEKFGMVLKPTENERWGFSEVIFDALQQRNLCKTQISGLMMSSRISSMYYYVRVLDRANKIASSHHTCTLSQCSDNPSQQLQPVHRDDCPGDCQQLCLPDMDSVIEKWIMNGLTPLVTWDAQNGLLACPYNIKVNTPRFGALSHSWSEGIVPCGRDAGGSNNRKMHLCQIKSLQTTFNNIIRIDESGPTEEKLCRTEAVPFWVDVLCMPRGKVARQAAMSQLDSIYSQACKVLAWDRSLLLVDQCPSRIDTSVRIRLGGWSQRLWALQETILAQSLVFECHNGKIVGLEDMKHDMECARHDTSHPYYYCWEVLSPFVTSVWRLHPPDRRNPSQRVHDLWMALLGRAVGNAEEETFVLCNILGLDASRVQSVLTPAENIQDTKMKLFLSMLDEEYVHGIPASIIFLRQSGRKLSGCGWAPRSWLGSMSSMSHIPSAVPSSDIWHPTTAFWGKRGLLVTFSGLTLTVIHGPSPLQSQISDQYLQAYIISGSVHSWYEIQIESNEHLESGQDNEELELLLLQNQLALILSCEPRGTWVVGLLVRSLQENVGQDIRYVERLRRVWVRAEENMTAAEMLDEKFQLQNRASYCAGKRTLPTQQWCICDTFVEKQPSAH